LPAPHAPEDLLTLNLTKLAVNVGDGGHNAGNHHVVQRVHSTVGELDGLIKRRERGLAVQQRSKHAECPRHYNNINNNNNNTTAATTITITTLAENYQPQERLETGWSQHKGYRTAANAA
jgi:hypothetical protein